MQCVFILLTSVFSVLLWIFHVFSVLCLLCLCARLLIQSNLGYPNANYPKLLGYSKTTDNPDFFSVLSIAKKLPIIRISIIRKIQFFEVIRRSRLKKLPLNYPSRFEVQMSGMVIMISLFGRVRFTHLSDLANKVATGN